MDGREDREVWCRSGLKLFAAPSMDADARVGSGGSFVEELAESFEAATGWHLAWSPPAGSKTDADWQGTAPENPGVGATPGSLVVGVSTRPLGRGAHRSSPQHVRRLARALGSLVDEVSRLRGELRDREAELAAGVPIVQRGGGDGRLAERLEAVLRGGAQALGCRAAGVYLLDAATTELKLRACWGLPWSRLAESPRPLKSAVADLEALTGHAVVLGSADVIECWGVPEACGSAVCVPVETPSAMLGTLWMYSAEAKDFSDTETNLAEIIAGRVAVELEREMLLAEEAMSRNLRRDADEIARLLQGQLPDHPPLLRGWDISGQLSGVGCGGTCHDWFPLTSGACGVLVAESAARGLAGVLAAQAVRSAVRSHASHAGNSTAALMASVAKDLWQGSSGDMACSAFYAVVGPSPAEIRLSLAGDDILSGVFRGGSLRPIAATAPPLGTDHDASPTEDCLKLEPGEAIVVVAGGTAGVARSRAGGSENPSLAEIEAALRASHRSGESAAETARHLAERLGAPADRSRGIVVLRRVP